MGSFSFLPFLITDFHSSDQGFHDLWLRKFPGGLVTGSMKRIPGHQYYPGTIGQINPLF